VATGKEDEMKAEYSDSSYSVGKGFANVTEKDYVSQVNGNVYQWIEGEIVTPHGFVDAISQNKPDATNLRFVYKGRIFNRVYEKRVGKKTLVTLAKRFVDDVVSGRINRR
jgi:hypothetical protein